MDANERERLTKAHQTAQLLLSDLRDIFASTTSVALEDLMINAINEIAAISQRLKRQSEQR